MEEDIHQWEKENAIEKLIVALRYADPSIEKLATKALVRIGMPAVEPRLPRLEIGLYLSNITQKRHWI